MHKEAHRIYSNKRRALIKFFTPQCGAYLRAAFIWKLDATKNCINYGDITFRIKRTELTSFYLILLFIHNISPFLIG